MSRITVQIDTESLKQTNSKSITGIIYFDFGESIQFPESTWNDFVIVILNWWLLALKYIATGHSDSEELRFMDGPFCIKVCEFIDGMFRLDCYSDPNSGVPEYSNQFLFEDLLSGVLDAATTINSVCDINNWSDDEILLMKHLIDELTLITYNK